MLLMLRPGICGAREARIPAAAIITTEFVRETQLTRIALGSQILSPSSLIIP
jgi:hypothetical protein